MRTMSGPPPRLTLDYERPKQYSPSRLGPPGPIGRAFIRLCYRLGRFVGLLVRR